MLVEISLAIIALVFVAMLIVIFPLITESRKTMKKMNSFLGELQKDIRDFSAEGLDLVENVNKLTIDLKRKSEDLNVIFRPLHIWRKEKSDLHPAKKGNVEKLAQLLEIVAEGMPLFLQFKKGIKNFAKSK